MRITYFILMIILTFSLSACHQEDRSFKECITVHNTNEDRCDNEYVNSSFDKIVSELKLDDAISQYLTIQYWELSDDHTMLYIINAEGIQGEFTRIETLTEDYKALYDYMNSYDIELNVMLLGETPVILGFNEYGVTGILVFENDISVDDLNTNKNLMSDFFSSRIFMSKRIRLGKGIATNTELSINDQVLTFEGEINDVLYSFLMSEYPEYDVVTE